MIFFGYDEQTASVVIGPQLFHKRTNPTVPQLLENGGDPMQYVLDDTPPNPGGAGS